MKRVTVKDIARASGYSVSTVSKTLNGTDRVGAETIEKIKRIASEMGYRSSFSAQSLARRPRRVGIVLFKHPGEVRRLFEMGFSESFDIYCEFGIEPVYYLFERMSALPWDEIEQSSDALIVTPGVDFDSCADHLESLSRRLPLVILQTIPSVPLPAVLSEVTVNARVVGAMAAQFIGLCHPGCETAILTGYRNSWIHGENIRGFLATASSCRIANIAIAECHDEIDSAYTETRRLLKTHPELGGIFVTSYVSPAVCQCIADMHRTTRVIGVDLFSSSAACLRNGSLTAALFQNQQKQAQLALEAIVSSFRGIQPEARMLVKPELILNTNLSCYGWI